MSDVSMFPEEPKSVDDQSAEVRPEDDNERMPPPPQFLLDRMKANTDRPRESEPIESTASPNPSPRREGQPSGFGYSSPDASVIQEEELIRPDPNRIGLWGLYGSGKTTFLTMLYYSGNEEWRVFVDETGKGHLFHNQQIDNPLDFLTGVYTKLLRERTYPNPTPTDMVNLFRFHLAYRAGATSRTSATVPVSNDRGRWPFRRTETEAPVTTKTQKPSPAISKRFQLEFLDASGEAFQNPVAWRNQYPHLTHPIDILKGCGRIVCLLDAQPLLKSERDIRKSGGESLAGLTEKANLDGQTYFEDLTHLLNQLTQHEMRLGTWDYGLQAYKFAFCITKSDIPAIGEHQDNIPGFVTRFFDETIIREIERYIPEENFDWFAVSAIGKREVDGRLASTTVEGGKLHPDHVIKPEGLFDPIEWLLGLK